MQDTNKSRKNLEWLESQRLELQISLTGVFSSLQLTSYS